MHNIQVRILRDNQRKSVSFADGIVPGEGTSPSGGEEIHSPPPPNAKPEKKEKKKQRKKKKVKVRIIKQYVLGDRMDSPPPPPDATPTTGVLKLYPGCTHYTCTAPGTFVIYTQQTLKQDETDLGMVGGSTVTIPPGMLIHSSALSKGFATGATVGAMGTSIPPSMPHSYPGYGFPSYFGEAQPTGDQSVGSTQVLHSPLA